ncbi:hypothetical protein C8F04DRAFT_1177967 [Mycena alexandri]|uniref:Uncharacterized protein n=1 Tax=Mycena alexandri TaxID=1745969 RepID=A0AAD6XCV8_9AGAR|nr:hypothetical protein C8F04DRAFT_1177967 [Mycena alexandri]
MTIVECQEDDRKLVFYAIGEPPPSWEDPLRYGSFPCFADTDIACIPVNGEICSATEMLWGIELGLGTSVYAPVTWPGPTFVVWSENVRNHGFHRLRRRLKSRRLILIEVTPDTFGYLCDARALTDRIVVAFTGFVSGFPMSSPTVPSTYGPWLVALFVETMFVQDRSYRRPVSHIVVAAFMDSVFRKFYYTSSGGLKIVSFFFASSYHRFVSKFGVVEDNLVWTDSVQMLTNYVSAFVVQMYFASSIYRLTHTHPASMKLSALRIHLAVALAVTQICLSLYCFRYRAGDRGCCEPRGRHRIVVAVDDDTVRTVPNAFWFFLSIAPASKLYMLSLLATLNMRQYMRNKVLPNDCEGICAIENVNFSSTSDIEFATSPHEVGFVEESFALLLTRFDQQSRLTSPVETGSFVSAGSLAGE